MGKTISIKVLFGIYLLLMAGKVFAFSCIVILILVYALHSRKLRG